MSDKSRKEILMTIVVNLFVLFLLSFNPSYSCADDSFGLGLVALTMDQEEEAIGYFLTSRSKNSRILIRKLQFPGSGDIAGIDYSDPTFVGFYAYIEILSHKPKYSFFAKIKEELDARNPNKELGQLGIFDNAVFSPKSKYLVMYCTYKTLVLDVANGKLLEMNDSEKSEEDTEITFSKDDRHIIRYRGSAGEEGDKVVSYEDFISKKKFWEVTLKDRVGTKFSKDCSKVWIYNYKAGLELTPLTIYEIDVKTGKRLSKKKHKGVTFEEARSYTEIKPERAHDHFLYTVYSPNKEFYLTGSIAYGNFSLKRTRNDEVVRDFWFHSDIE